jgi:hypothetical protein
MSDAKSVAAATTPKPAGLWEDFIDIFYAPSEVFARRALAGPWAPLLIVTVAISALVYVNTGVLQPMMGAEFDRAMAATMKSNPQLTREMVDQFRTVGLRVAQFGGYFTPIAIVCVGTMVWLIGKLFESRQAYGAAIMVAAYAFVPRILESVLNGLQGLVLDPETLDGHLRLTLGVGRFLNPDTVSPMLLALLGRIDLFTIWVTVLLAIGLSVTGGIPRARAFMAAPLIWAVGAIPLVLQALRSR